jgi:small subunit ribosomal protein S6
MAEQAKAKTRQYEGMFLLGPGATADPTAALNIARGMIERHGGQVMVIKKWDERKLYYEIKKQKRGTYIIAYFTAPSTAITPLEREVKLSDDVLRVLITDASHLNQQEMEAVEPQPIQKVEERPSWDRPYGDRPPREDRPRDDRPRDDRGPREERSDRPARPPRREDAPAEAAAAKD